MFIYTKKLTQICVFCEVIITEGAFKQGCFCLNTVRAQPEVLVCKLLVLERKGQMVKFKWSNSNGHGTGPNGKIED